MPENTRTRLIRPTYGSEVVFTTSASSGPPGSEDSPLTGFPSGVVTVGSGNEAMATLGDAGLSFDALVTDYAMPGMNGADLVLQAREQRPMLPALIITGYAGAEGLDRLPPDVAILRKPFQREDLVHAVKGLIEGLTPASGLRVKQAVSVGEA